MISERGVNDKLLIEIDGGVGKNNWQKLVQAGADVLVAGSSTFNANDPQAAIREMKGN